jgi:hypothetical protein
MSIKMRHIETITPSRTLSRSRELLAAYQLKAVRVAEDGVPLKDDLDQLSEWPHENGKNPPANTDQARGHEK